MTSDESEVVSKLPLYAALGTLAGATIVGALVGRSFGRGAVGGAVGFAAGLFAAGAVGNTIDEALNAEPKAKPSGDAPAKGAPAKKVFEAGKDIQKELDAKEQKPFSVIPFELVGATIDLSLGNRPQPTQNTQATPLPFFGFGDLVRN